MKLRMSTTGFRRRKRSKTRIFSRSAMIEPLKITPFSLAQRYVGEVFERAGDKDHPLIQWWISRCTGSLDESDETAWCSSFINGICWELRLPRSKSLAARSWLTVGVPIDLEHAEPGFDVVVLSRGALPQPGPERQDAPGHVGFFAGRDSAGLYLLGGNQNNGVSIALYPRARLLSVRRLT